MASQSEVPDWRWCHGVKGTGEKIIMVAAVTCACFKGKVMKVSEVVPEPCTGGVDDASYRAQC